MSWPEDSFAEAIFDGLYEYYRREGLPGRDQLDWTRQVRAISSQAGRAVAQFALRVGYLLADPGTVVWLRPGLREALRHRERRCTVRSWRVENAVSPQ